MTCHCLADPLSGACKLPKEGYRQSFLRGGIPVRLVAHESLPSYGLLMPVRVSILSPINCSQDSRVTCYKAYGTPRRRPWGTTVSLTLPRRGQCNE